MKETTRLLVWPSIIYLFLFVILQNTGLDERISGWFYDPEFGGYPLKNAYWTRDVLHHGGRNVMLTVLSAVAVLWVLSRFLQRLSGWKTYSSYLLAAMLLSVLLVNVGKRVSNTDCPWDLSDFGGQRPYISLFADKPNDLPAGRCFPGGHSSGGFALLGLFFIARQQRWQRPALALLPAMLIGGVFSGAQWARGAHFASHDLTTMYLCWLVAYGLAAWFFRIKKDKQDEPL